MRDSRDAALGMLCLKNSYAITIYVCDYDTSKYHYLYPSSPPPLRPLSFPLSRSAVARWVKSQTIKSAAPDSNLQLTSMDFCCVFFVIPGGSEST